MGLKEFTFAIESLVCLAILIPLLLQLVPSTRLDGFRQDMFSVRDELFDFAASGRVSFSDPAYRLLRQLMNGFIRYGHQLTLFRVTITVVEFKIWGHPDSLSWDKKWKHALENIKDEEVRNELVKFHDRAAMLVAVRLVFGSPILIFALICAMFTMLVNKGLRSLTQLVNDAASTTVSRIVDTRLLEEEAIKEAAA